MLNKTRENIVSQFSLRLLCGAALGLVAVAALGAEEVPTPKELPAVVVTAKKEDQTQTTTAVDRDQFKNAPAFSIAEPLSLLPGVTFIQANGPRDVSISVRGSNNRSSFGVRNVKVYEDGFPVTQPDGLARTDLADPHAYSSIEVLQGPSSAFYGNYATGGVIDFTTQTGKDLQGVEAGMDAGSFGYLNLYATAAGSGDRYDYGAFGSHVRGQSYTEHTRYSTTTENVLVSFQATPDDRWTLKFINNDLDTDLSFRLSLNQYVLNPYQKSCDNASAAAAGCASVTLNNNGFNNSAGTSTQSPEQSGAGRHDRRTIVGGRWEHRFDQRWQWRTQFVFDNRDIKQPTSTTSAVGTFPSYNLMSDVIYTDALFGWASVGTMGVFYNFEDVNSNTYNVMPGGDGTLGALTQRTIGTHTNAGFRLREELTFNPQWSVVTGVGAEYTVLKATNTAFAYPTATPTTTVIKAQREFINVAPEVAVQFAPDKDWRFHARVGGGYGTPQVTNLFVTPAGTAGNNTDLKAQRNIGLDLGADWQYGKYLSANLTGFYELFRDELVSQSAGVGLQSYIFNAPKSEHRGFIAGFDWHPLPEMLPGGHWAASYLYDDQIYTEYTERLTTGAVSASFDRGGKHIPGVQPHYLNTRLIYDQPSGPLQGLGGYVEMNFRDDFTLDNGNLLEAPGYVLTNLNLHYNAPPGLGFLSRVTWFFAAQNLFDKTYVASASNLTNSLNAAGQQNPASVLANSGGLIYAGSPRLFYSGIRLKF